jgi:DNA-binding transcriptional ArsR family regulator
MGLGAPGRNGRRPRRHSLLTVRPDAITYNYMVISRDERLDRVFQALADPTRRRILERLAAGDQPVSELVRHFDMSQPAVTKHLNVLQRAGLITRHRSGRLRLSRARHDALRSPMRWMRRYTRLWNDRLDTLEALLANPTLRKELDR